MLLFYRSNWSVPVTAVTSMNDVLTGCDRISNTPLPLAYNIAIAQITLAYVLALPFQLVKTLRVKMIPATILAGYIILSLVTIGGQIENPFGDDVNDLPLESYCDEIAESVDLIMSSPAPRPADFVKNVENLPLNPVSRNGYEVWAGRDESLIRDALKSKVGYHFYQKHGLRYRQMGSEEEV
jgi:putative membrane protein